jgi:hypothetical protein
LNHEVHEEHEGNEEKFFLPFLRALRVLRGKMRIAVGKILGLNFNLEYVKIIFLCSSFGNNVHVFAEDWARIVRRDDKAERDQAAEEQRSVSWSGRAKIAV